MPQQQFTLALPRPNPELRDKHVAYDPNAKIGGGPAKSKFKIGDSVRPKPEWTGTPNNIPSGFVRAIAPWGDIGALYIGADKRAFSAHVFEWDGAVDRPLSPWSDRHAALGAEPFGQFGIYFTYSHRSLRSTKSSLIPQHSTDAALVSEREKER